MRVSVQMGGLVGLSEPEYNKKSVDMAQQCQVSTQKVSEPELMKMSIGVFNIRA